MHMMQVFVPREDLSLDVIKQYQVVSDPVSKPSSSVRCPHAADAIVVCVTLSGVHVG